MKLFKNFISLIVAVLLFLSLLAAQYSYALKKDIFNEKFYVSTFDKNKLYDSLNKSIEDKLSDSLKDSKIPTELLSDIITSEWVETQCKTTASSIIDILSGKSKTLKYIDTQTLVNKFDDNVQKSLKAKNIPDATIKRETERMNKVFIEKLQVLPFSEHWNSSEKDKLLKDLVKAGTYASKLNIIFLGSLSASVLLLIVLIFLRRGIISKKTWISYVFILNGLFVAVSSFIVSNTQISDSIVSNSVNIPSTSVLSVKPMLPMLTALFNKPFSNAEIYGAVLALIGIIIFSLFSLFDNFGTRFYDYRHPLK